MPTSRWEPGDTVNSPHSAAPNNLADLRQAAGYSQREVAEQIYTLSGSSVGASANTVSRWERGEVVPGPMYRRLIAKVFDVTVDDLGLTPARSTRPESDFLEAFMDDDATDHDPRVVASHDRWRQTRRVLNANRHKLTHMVAQLYPTQRLGDTGLITQPEWLPDSPVDVADITLEYQPNAPEPLIDGTGPATEHIRPQISLVGRYQRYTHAIRDLAQPRLFENRACWRYTELAWSTDKGRMGFTDSSYFAGVDVYEALAHETALMGLSGPGGTAVPLAMRNLPFRRRIGDPFDLTRRPLLPSISTLTIRRDRCGGSEFLLHRRDSRSVAVAGGMLQVIPSGVFQPSSVLPAAVEADFDLWRNVQREYSEELLGNPECNGDGQPVDYGLEPFASLDQARSDGRLRVFCLGVALDALTLVGEVLTVAVFDADFFDSVAGDFVERNDEGTVVNQRVPFTEDGVARVLASGQMAAAGAGCIHLAWQHRDVILG